MFHSVPCGLLVQATASEDTIRQHFKSGNFYGVVEYTPEHLARRGYTPQQIAVARAVETTKKVLEKWPNEFKLVYQSKPFLNSYHNENSIPYLVLCVLEKT